MNTISNSKVIVKIIRRNINQILKIHLKLIMNKIRMALISTKEKMIKTNILSIISFYLNLFLKII